jgi:hypothetical protein
MQYAREKLAERTVRAANDGIDLSDGPPAEWAEPGVMEAEGDSRFFLDSESSDDHGTPADALDVSLL